MKISIAMATYNGAKYLQSQLDSFLDQTRLPDELMVCDDGSTDDTLEMLEAFRPRARFPVHIFRNATNLGYIKNFEKALSLCTGDVIFLSDQDDVWFNKKIERIVDEFELRDSKCVIVNDAEIVHGDLEKTGLTVAGQLVTAGMNLEQLLLGCCIAFRSELKPLILPIPYRIHGHDGWINTLGNTLHCRHFVPDVLQYYRRHDRNTSSSPTTRTSLTNRWHLLREKLKLGNIKRDPCSASARRLEQLNVLRERLVAHECCLKQNLPRGICVSDVIAEINQEQSANESRLSLQQLPFVQRLIAGFRFFLSGGYRQFDGWKSLARDIVR